ncbi:MAG: flagellar export chaperone FliS [Chloroflexi bacterium]|nr:flagellar export chaperone FliS [Chloroflexota bacterium]
MPLSPYQQYQATTVETASPVDLVVMLYQGAHRFIRQALAAIETHDIQTAHRGFLRAQDIITELAGSLSAEEGGEISEQLRALYEYMHRRLVEANCHKDPAPAREVLGMLRELGSAWQQIAAQQRQGQAPTPSPGRVIQARPGSLRPSIARAV